MGIDVGTFDPFVHLELYEPPPEGTTGLLAGSGVPSGRCVLNGMAIDCGWAMEMKSSGAAVPCPGNDCGPRSVVYQGQRTWAFFNAYADGYQGYVPTGARYIGNGNFSAWTGGPPSRRSNTIHDTNFTLLNSATGEAQLGRTSSYALHDVWLQSPQNPSSNPNCIEKAVADGKVSGRGLEEAVSAASGRPVPTGFPVHNGEHVLIPPGATAPVTALPLMAGRILHGSRQTNDRGEKS